MPGRRDFTGKAKPQSVQRSGSRGAAPVSGPVARGEAASKPPPVKAAARSFAVLHTAKPPSQQVRLISASAEAKLDVEFEPLQYTEPLGAMLGMATPRVDRKLELPSMTQVQRGRLGHKAEELLCMLTPVPVGADRWPRARWVGLAKGAGRAMLELSGDSKEPRPVIWWLALAFAMNGYATIAEYKKIAHGLGVGAVALPGMEQVGSLVVWNDFIERESEELERRVRARQQRNPFITSVDRDQVQRWMGLDNAGLAGRILRSYSQRAKLKLGRSLLGHVVLLGQERTTLPFGERQAFEAIMNGVESDQFTTQHELQSAFSSKMHVIAWLLDADMLFDCGGYLFSRQMLWAALDLLRIKKVDLALAGVRDIKDILGYPRRKAEALRAFIVQRFGRAQPEPRQEVAE